MAWTVPMTAVSNAVWTSAEWNTYIRDALNETIPAKAENVSDLFFGNGSNGVVTRPGVLVDTVSTAETLNTTAYSDLATVGPEVTFQKNSGQPVTIVFGALLSAATTNSYAIASVELSGATTYAASDNHCLQLDGVAGNNPQRLFSCLRIAGGSLGNGATTVTMKYRSNASATFSNRFLAVLPF